MTSFKLYCAVLIGYALGGMVIAVLFLFVTAAFEVLEETLQDAPNGP